MEALPSMMERKGEEKRFHVPRPVLYALIILAFIAFAVGISILIYNLDPDDRSPYPEHLIAITGVAGLDDVVVDRPTSPVFNLILCINNTNDKYEACIPILSTAFVFCGNALLRKGPLQSFCGEAKEEHEGRARTWATWRCRTSCGISKSASWNEATWRWRSRGGYEAVLVCRAKVEGGPPCQMTQVQPGVQPT